MFTDFRRPVPADWTCGQWAQSRGDVDVARLLYWAPLAAGLGAGPQVEGWPSLKRSFAEVCAKRTIDLAVVELRAAEVGSRLTRWPVLTPSTVGPPPPGFSLMGFAVD